MKAIRNIFRTTLLILAITITPMLVFAYNTGDDYPADYKDRALDAETDRWNFYNRECTSFVAWCLNSRNGVNFTNQYGGVPLWGDAKTWGQVARSLGISVDGNPAVGAVAWTDEGYYGHVAWVQAVNGDQVIIEEYNNSVVAGAPGLYSTRPVNKNSFQYIHISDISSITLNSPSEVRINKGSQYQIDVSIVGNDGNVTWKTSNKKIVTVTKTGKVKGIKAGSATITASYAGKNVSCKVTVCNKSLKLSCNTLTLTKGKTKKIKATVKGASSEVVWKSSLPMVATVSDNGVVNAVGGGKTVISATANGITKKCSVKVNLKKSITLSCKSLTVTAGKTAKIYAVVNGMKKNIHWSTSNKKIATVKNGKVAGKKKGTATITAKCGKLKAKCIVNVKKDDTIYHTEKGRVCYKNYRSSLHTPFSLNVTVKGNKLILEGRLDKSIDAGDYVPVKGKKHVFILTSKTKYWMGYYNGDFSKKQFIDNCKNYMKNRESGKDIWLSVEMKDGKVYRVGTAPWPVWERVGDRYYDMDRGWVKIKE